TIEGELWHAEEWFFLARLNQPVDVDTSGFTQLELDTITEHRWWDVRELARTTDVVYPPEFAVLLPPLLAGRCDGRAKPISGTPRSCTSRSVTASPCSPPRAAAHAIRPGTTT